MPAPPSVPNVLKFTWLFSLTDDNPVTARQFFSYTGGPPTDADCDSLANSAWAHWGGDLINYLSSTFTLTGADVVDLSSPTAGTGTFLADAVGGHGSPPVTNGVATLVNAAIARRYRGGKPRTYWPMGTTADKNDDRTWSSTYIAAVQAAYVAFIAAMLATTAGTTALAAHVNVSYYSGFNTVGPLLDGKYKYPPKYRAVPIVDPILSTAINPVFGSQRRRVTRR